MDINFVWSAGEHTVIAEGVFNHLIGEEIPLQCGDMKTTGVLKRAKISDDGRSVSITVSAPESMVVRMLGRHTDLVLDTSLLNPESP